MPQVRLAQPGARFLSLGRPSLGVSAVQSKFPLLGNRKAGLTMVQLAEEIGIFARCPPSLEPTVSVSSVEEVHSLASLINAAEMKTLCSSSLLFISPSPAGREQDEDRLQAGLLKNRSIVGTIQQVKI